MVSVATRPVGGFEEGLHFLGTQHRPGHRGGLGGRVGPENLVELVAAQDEVAYLVGIDECGEPAGVTASEVDRGFPLRGHQRAQVHEVA